MNFKANLIKGKLLKRYKRFLADIELDNGEQIIAHCPNPGSMMGIIDPGNAVWVSQVDEDSPRKLRYTWEVTFAQDTHIGVNTNLPNALVEEAIINQSIPELARYNKYKREVKYGQNSRIDFFLGGDSVKPCYLEIKNAHLKRGDHAQFPDSVTSRGAKHMVELINMMENGFDAMVLYVVQRDDCEYFSIASDIDPYYAQMAQKSHVAGVKHLSYNCDVSPQGIIINKPIKVVF